MRTIVLLCVLNVFSICYAQDNKTVTNSDSIEEQNQFREDYVTISGRLLSDTLCYGKRIYCQFPYFHKPNDIRMQDATISKDGTFSIRFKISYPGNASFIVYPEGERFTEGKTIASDIHVRPGEHIELSIISSEEERVKLKSNMTPIYPHIAQHAPTFIRRRMEIISDNENALEKIVKLKELNDSVMLVAQQIISDYNFSEEEATMYINKLQAIHYKWCAYALKDYESPEVYDEIMLSIIKELQPYDKSYFYSSVFDHMTGLFPHTLDSIRNNVYRQAVGEDFVELEKKVMAAQNEFINNKTGWVGLSFVAQAAYISGLISAPAQDITDTQLSNLCGMFTHPYFKMAAKEMILGKRKSHK